MWGFQTIKKFIIIGFHGSNKLGYITSLVVSFLDTLKRGQKPGRAAQSGSIPCIYFKGTKNETNNYFSSSKGKDLLKAKWFQSISNNFLASKMIFNHLLSNGRLSSLSQQKFTLKLIECLVLGRFINFLFRLLCISPNFHFLVHFANFPCCKLSALSMFCLVNIHSNFSTFCFTNFLFLQPHEKAYFISTHMVS